jgi:hypothetical protein
VHDKAGAGAHHDGITSSSASSSPPAASAGTLHGFECARLFFSSLRISEGAA